MVDEQAHLELADKHIREARERIARQEGLVQSLAAGGHDTASADVVLETFRETLVSFLDHRALIVKELERQAGATDPDRSA